MLILRPAVAEVLRTILCQHAYVRPYHAGPVAGYAYDGPAREPFREDEGRLTSSVGCETLKAVRWNRTTEKAQMAIRCKMRLENIFAQAYGGCKAIFRCEYDQKVAEDISFQKATPSGFAEYIIDNPKATEQLVIGKAYYVDFTQAD